MKVCDAGHAPLSPKTRAEAEVVGFYLMGERERERERYKETTEGKRTNGYRWARADRPTENSSISKPGQLNGQLETVPTCTRLPLSVKRVTLRILERGGG